MRILMAASEAVPFCKTGGLADVVGALSQKLGAAGHDVLLFLPKYRDVETETLQGGMARPISVPLGGEAATVSLRWLQWRSVSVCFVEHAASFDREGLYTRDGQDHADNDRRFALFSRAVLEGAKALGFRPDVVHAHDWQTSLLPAMLKRAYRDDPFFAGAASVLTIHNMAYQGNFPRAALALTGLPESDFGPDGVEFYGKLSYLKAGLLFADMISTVSPSYAREIQESPDRGFGFEGLLSRRGADVAGILNGLDLEVWNPERDPHLPARFSARDSSGKRACKSAVLKECGLPDDGLALLGVVSRLDYQKGLDLAVAALEPRLERCRLAVVGAGDPALQEAIAALARRRPDRVHFHSGFDDPFAHRLYAGSDLFLMPSRFEPCGLGQMIAMRYGSVPVVTRTGGLADTVFEGRNGFVAAPGDGAALGEALDRALDAYGSPAWPRRVAEALAADFSWEGSIGRYLELYRDARARAAAR